MPAAARQPDPPASTPRLRVVESAAFGYRYSRCRAMGHRWSDPYIDEVRDREYRVNGGYGRRITCDCEVCPTRKHGTMDWLGNIYKGWTFDYPPDYRWSSEDPVTKADWRLQYTRSLGITVKKPRKGVARR